MKSLALAVFCATAAELAAIGLTATATWMIVRAAGHPPLAALAVAIVAVRTLAVTRGALRYADRVVGHEAVLGQAGELRARVYRSLAARARRHGGAALAAVVTDVTDAQDHLLRKRLPRLSATLTCAIAITVTTLVAPAAGLVLACGLAITGVVLPRCCPAVVASAHAELSGYAVDLTRGHDDLLVLGALDHHRAAAAAVSRAAAAAQRRTATRTSTIGAAAIVIQAITALAVLTAAGPGTPVGAALALTALGAIELTIPLLDPIRRPAPPADVTPEPQPPLTEEIQLDHVHARTLHDLSLTIHKGQKLAVVGATGAGKSTLLDLLTGLLPPERGTVTGRATGNHDDAWVFAASIRANLLMARPTATDTDLHTALTTVDLTANLDATATELSGGQRQRLLLARALLADPPVLILDEPVAALDPPSADKLLTEALRTTTGAVVLATHRLSALTAVDEVLVLDQGKIIQRGPHTTLATTPGPYRDALLIEQSATP